MAYDVKLAMDQLKIDRANIVGHSLGSVISQVIAEDYPERVERVVLVGSTSSASGIYSAEGEFAQAIESMKERPALDSEFLSGWFDSVLPVDPEFIKYEKNETSKVPLQVWKGITHEAQTNEFGRHLARLKAPTLLVYGVHDNFMDKQSQEILKKSIANLTYVEYQSAGHNIPWELPKEFAENVESFIQKNN
ncbi:Tropinesterase [compost metagenome]